MPIVGTPYSFAIPAKSCGAIRLSFVDACSWCSILTLNSAFYAELKEGAATADISPSSVPRPMEKAA